jgi:hypothetical protein
MKNKRDSILATGIGFDDADLDANRAGHLTPKQIERLLAENRTTNQGLVGIMIFLSVIFLGLGLMGLNDTGNSGIAWVMALVWLGMVALFGSLIWDNRRVQDEIRQGQVESVQGPVQCYTGGKNARYNCRVGDLIFSGIRQEVYTAFRHLDVYTLYYLPRSKRIVAAEELPSD